jgi:hypothetical protein
MKSTNYYSTVAFRNVRVIRKYYLLQCFDVIHDLLSTASERGFGPGKKVSSDLQQGGPGKNLGLDLEGFIKTNTDTTEKDKNISNIDGPR